VRTQHVRFWCREFENCRTDMMIAQCVKEGCECSVCEETNCGKQINHNSRLIYCSAVANSKWKWLILNRGVWNSLISTAARFLYSCQEVYMLNVTADCLGMWWYFSEKMNNRWHCSDYWCNCCAVGSSYWMNFFTETRVFGTFSLSHSLTCVSISL
jgi:hypothetical protein